MPSGHSGRYIIQFNEINELVWPPIQFSSGRPMEIETIVKWEAILKILTSFGPIESENGRAVYQLKQLLGWTYDGDGRNLLTSILKQMESHGLIWREMSGTSNKTYTIDIAIKPEQLPWR